MKLPAADVQAVQELHCVRETARGVVVILPHCHDNGGTAAAPCIAATYVSLPYCDRAEPDAEVSAAFRHCSLDSQVAHQEVAFGEVTVNSLWQVRSFY
jgi:hypothetical protein